METIIFDLDNDRFIQQAVKFCATIDKYTELLGINAMEVDRLKSDVNLALYISSSQLSMPPSIVRYNMTEIRNRLADICNDCRSSKHYTEAIGLEQGLVCTGLERHSFAENWHSLFAEILYTSVAA
jgi:hypothetical protein